MPVVRIETNPSKLGYDGMLWLHQVLSPVMPGGWVYVLEKATVSRVDFAVDLPNCELDDFVCLSARYSRYCTFTNKSEFESLYLGSKKGTQFNLYRKDKEVLKKGGEWDGPPAVRVEARVKPKSFALKNLFDLPNPFAKLTIAQPLGACPEGVRPQTWTLFKIAAWEMGVEPALQLFVDKHRKIIRCHIKSTPHPEWDADQIWENRDLAHEVLGITKVTQHASLS
jgi:hypothetical protein